MGIVEGGKRIHSNFLATFMAGYQQLKTGKLSLDDLIQELSKYAIFSEDFNVSEDDYRKLMMSQLDICKLIKNDAEESKLIAPLGSRDLDREKELVNQRNQDLEIIQLIAEKIEGVCQRELCRIEEKIAPFGFLFACDFDAEDYNGIVALSVLESLQNNIPVLTTDTVMRKTSPTRSDFRTHIALGNKCLTEELASKFHMFTDTTGKFLFFFPKKEGVKSVDLSKLGLEKNSWGELSFSSLFEDEKISKEVVEATIFSKNSSCDKHIALMGHGGDGYIGGLHVAHYRDLLEVFSRPNFRLKSLDITSCNGGGNNQLEHYLQGEKLEEKRPLPFPIVIRSIGDMTTTEISHFKDVFTNFNGYQKESPNTIQSMGRHQKHSNVFSAPQVLFPTNGPQGFRILPTEKAPFFLLSYTKMRAYEYQRKEKIEVKDAIFCVYPLTVHLPITINQKAGSVMDEQQLLKGEYTHILHSAIPGKAHHYFREIELPESNLHQLLGDITMFNHRLESSKAFFIERFKDKEGEYQHVVIRYLGRSTTCLRCYDDKNGKTIYEELEYFGSSDYEDVTEHLSHVTQLSKEEYVSQVSQTLLLTVPHTEAVRVSTGGQDSEQSFLDEMKKAFVGKDAELLFNANFNSDHSILKKALKQDPGAIRYVAEKIQKACALDIVGEKGMDLEFFPDILKDDEEIVIKAVKNSGRALEFASNALQDNKDVVKAAIEQAKEAFKWASDRLKEDKDLKKLAEIGPRSEILCCEIL